MSKILELYNENFKDIYTKFPQKQDGDVEPFVSYNLVNPPKMNPQFEDQSNPVSLSAGRDLKRLTNFSTSTKGLLFLGKQTLLQTGNTWAQTRLYNPANVLIHTVPFVHKSRYLNIRQAINSLQGIDYVNNGKVQQETANTVRDVVKLKVDQRGGIMFQTTQEFEKRRVSVQIINPGQIATLPGITASGVKKSFTKFLKNTAKSQFAKVIDVVVNQVNNTVSAIKAQVTDPSVGITWEDSRPELSMFANGYIFQYQNPRKELRVRGVPVQGSQLNLEYNTPFFDSHDRYKNEVANYKNQNGKRISIGLSGINDSLISIFDDGEALIFKSPTVEEDRNGISRKRYYKDLTQINKDSIFKEDIPENLDTDSIDVIFYIGEQSKSVRFRAFITDINETVTPTYNETNYINRIETFYTYKRVIRDLSFKLNLMAFSEQELEHIWQKAEYLSTLAYPLDIAGGYIKPTIFNFIIGDMYNHQPGILTSITHTIDEKTSWDIDMQTPMSVVCDLKIRLLDKRLFYANSNLRYDDYQNLFGINERASLRTQSNLLRNNADLLKVDNLTSGLADVSNIIVTDDISSVVSDSLPLTVNAPFFPPNP